MPQPSETPDAKQSLLALLPSAQDAVTIVTSSTAWLWGAETPSGSVLTPNDTVQLLDIPAISMGSTMHVAKILLLFALYMQQLPANFDAQFLESQSIEKATEMIVDRVQIFMLSHHDEACSLDGLECLALLCTIQLNDGALKKAWMTLRRFVDMARLQGLQTSFALTARNSQSSEVALQRRLWQSGICGECYCSLLLGLEPGLGIAPFGPVDETWNDAFADENANIQRRICLIVARIAQRNAVGLYHDVDTFREIDEALKKLDDSLSRSWWKAPSFRQDRSLDSAKEPNRLICQLWLLQARMFNHMPFAFGSNEDAMSRSLEVCMEACRMTLHRYFGLRHAKDHLNRCRSVDQSAFVAAVVLLLGKVQARAYKVDSTVSRYDSDMALLEQIIEAFEEFGKAGSRERVSTQIFEILSTMINLAASSSRSAGLGADFDAGMTLLSPDSEITIPDTPNIKRSEMEEIIAASILPALDPRSPTADLINRLFAIRESTNGCLGHVQETSNIDEGLTIGDVIDLDILQEATRTT